MTVIYFEAGEHDEVFTVHCEVCKKPADRISADCLVWLSRRGQPIICEGCDNSQWQFLPPKQLLVKPDEILVLRSAGNDPIKEIFLEAGQSVGMGSDYCVPVYRNGVK